MKKKFYIGIILLFCSFRGLSQVVVDSIIIDLKLEQNSVLKELGECYICELEVAISSSNEIAISTFGRINFLDGDHKVSYSIIDSNNITQIYFTNHNDLVGYYFTDTIVTATLLSDKKNWHFYPITRFIDWQILVDSSVSEIRKVPFSYSIEEILDPEFGSFNFNSLMNYSGDKNNHLIAIPHHFIKRIVIGDSVSNEYFVSTKYDEHSSLLGYINRGKVSKVIYQRYGDLFIENLSTGKVTKVNSITSNLREPKYKIIPNSSTIYSMYRVNNDALKIYLFTIQ